MTKTKHKIIIGDALEKLKEIPSESIDLVFADPPYNMSKKSGLAWKYSKHITMQESWDMFSKDEFFEFNLKWITECLRILKHVMFGCAFGLNHTILLFIFILFIFCKIKPI